ncbi:hypothetical protein CA51_17240 [Rosistilla oblonga]|nr:hypothetical protein CA51_17240 [Rosistilla oblonga]
MRTAGPSTGGPPDRYRPAVWRFCGGASRFFLTGGNALP